MDIASIAGGGTSAELAANQQNAFRDADFLAIMLTEITNQDPLNPSETSKMIDGMRQLQMLANTANEKFRADVTWAQQMVGTVVNVTQVTATPGEEKAYIDAGLRPDMGYGNKDIRVEGFRVVGQTVWISTDEGLDYPVDNIKQIRNDTFNTGNLVETSSRLLGMRVSYLTTETGGREEGTVSSVGYDSTGKVVLGVNGGYVRYDDVVAITVPPSTTP